MRARSVNGANRDWEWSKVGRKNGGSEMGAGLRGGERH